MRLEENEVIVERLGEMRKGRRERIEIERKDKEENGS